nr:hypothetical protein B0A51_08035 [Rachicladosporium sp. CCFEE 5018]
MSQPHTCLLLELPVEVQTRIFRLAYPLQPDFRWTQKFVWDKGEQEKGMMSLDYTAKPFPGYKGEKPKLLACARLKSLTVEITYEWDPDFGRSGKRLWQDCFTDEEIDALLDGLSVLHLRGLDEFVVQAPSIRYATTDEAKDMLKANAARTEPSAQQSAVSESGTFDEVVADLEMLRDLMTSESKVHEGTAIAEGFPSIEDHAKWLEDRGW